MQITKAYTILTDPVARENFQKFGNPDGRGMFDVSIALPAFLSDKDYQLHVLITFFVLVVVLIPGYFYSVLSQVEKDQGGVELKNREIFAKLIDETMMGKVIPGILGQGLEFAHIQPTNEKE